MDKVVQIDNKIGTIPLVAWLYAIANKHSIAEARLKLMLMLMFSFILVKMQINSKRKWHGLALFAMSFFVRRNTRGIKRCIPKKTAMLHSICLPTNGQTGLN